MGVPRLVKLVLWEFRVSLGVGFPPDDYLLHIFSCCTSLPLKHSLTSSVVVSFAFSFPSRVCTSTEVVMSHSLHYNPYVTPSWL